MPFIKQERRNMIDEDQYYSVSKTHEGIQPGDRCYFYYKKMVEAWRADPRWTTAHKIYGDMLNAFLANNDDFVASRLAWQVFFIKYVMPYENQKELENGDI